MNKIYSVGIGPGGVEFMTAEALKAIETAEVIIGYKFYLDLVKDLIQDKDVFGTGMKKERERAAEAFRIAQEGRTVAVISSGDSGVYGMAPLLWEMKMVENYDTELEVVAGISAMMAAAAILGAPLGHDFCSISMSDLLTPWATIEKRIVAAASADFVTGVYNPKSKGRFWQLKRLQEIFLEHRSTDTPVGVVRQAGRPEQSSFVTTLKDLDVDKVDMFSVVVIGNSQSQGFENKIVTPRGYYKEESAHAKDNLGRKIMNKSFSTILEQLDYKEMSLEKLWVALHAIHTTADFSIADKLLLSNDVIKNAHAAFYSGQAPVIVTDVRMVTNGIRKAIAEKLGLEIKCYLDDERVMEMSQNLGITRTQAGIRLAVKEHPDALYAFGNAPTALIELIKHIRNGEANPAAVVAAPVGFVNVCESKWQLRYGCADTPHIIVDGRKGGSNIAATIINSILSWSEAEAMHPGEGV